MSNEVNKRILEDEDYIKHSKSYDSLKRFMAQYPDGVDDLMISRILLMTEDQVKEYYEQAVQLLKEELDED